MNTDGRIAIDATDAAASMANRHLKVQPAMQRRAIEVNGIVQGVGFRPFVHQLATRLGLGGFVQNRVGTVLIEVEGEPQHLEQFCHELTFHPPALARIESWSWVPRLPTGERAFSIEPSTAAHQGAVFIPSDTAVCRACLAELMDPLNRRYRYPFINCTHCGPRLTIIVGAPYDREHTTMAQFPMCDLCRAEFEDPTNRRFHAQPIACADCGPQLVLSGLPAAEFESHDPLVDFATALLAGKIGALKGLGGYHLVCDARNEAVVHELRRRKTRESKPLAIMVRDVAVAERLCHVTPQESQLLCSPEAPIVLLRRRTDASLAPSIAPGNPYLGIMLPYTPLHHLLLEAVGSIPLVATSGNRRDEPIAYEDDDAVSRLASIADCFLMHDRPIHVRCDDSVVRMLGSTQSFVRRSRGYAPRPLRLAQRVSVPILAVGGQLKGTFALGCEDQAFVSHHLGDLDDFAAFRAFERDIALYEQLFAISPAVIAHDMHPDYNSTRYALERHRPLIAVQHHHAHMASCMAEHGIVDPVIGVTFDGSGLGLDGAIWGGEFLVGDLKHFERAAHLRYVPMPGGERAVREPWRMAIAHSLDAGVDCHQLQIDVPLHALQTVKMILQKRVNSPLTSSMGRLFDAVAALAQVRAVVDYEGQAAQELEYLATGMNAEPPVEHYTWALEERTVERSEYNLKTLCIDTRPLVHGVVDDCLGRKPASFIARRFHSSIVALTVDVCQRVRELTALNKVILSGGVFMNALLASETRHRLSAAGFDVYQHERVPPNDGGLSLGQLAVAASRLADGPLD